MSLGLFISGVISVIILFYNFYYKRRNLPPGPTPLPLVGNLLSVLWAQWSSCPEDAFLKWKAKYGSVYTFWMSEIPVVVIADFSTAEKHFVKEDGDAFAARPTFTSEFNRLTRGGDMGIIGSSGDLWLEHRRFTLRVLKDLGVGKKDMENKILYEISSLLDLTKLHCDQMAEEMPLKFIDFSLGSIINSILFGRRFNYQEDYEEFHHLKGIIHRFFEAFCNPFILPCLSYPKMFRYIPPFSHVLGELEYCFKEIFKYAESHITRHKNERISDVLNNNVNFHKAPSDFLHAYLNETKKYEADGQQHSFCMNQALNMCFDLFLAGQENVNTTLSWGIAYILWNPSVQAAAHKELDDRISSSRLITCLDRPRLPYTCAVVAEFQRISNLLPQNLLRNTTREVNINGFKIPSNTNVVPQISAILYNNEIFNDPLKFNPMRFIHNGKFKEPPEFVPFSIGKRRCVGEQLARIELFLFVANLLNHFEFIPTKTLPNLTRSFGPAAQCPPFKCMIRPRKKFPPGPIPLPFVGNLWTIAKHLPGEECYLKWLKEYGPIYTYWVGEMPVVCVADYPKIMDMFQKDGDTYAGRTVFPRMDALLKGGVHGVFNTEGEIWRDQRRLSMHILQDFGTGRKFMEERVMTEVASLLENIDAEIDAGLLEHNLAEHLAIGAGSTINDVLFGYRFVGEKTTDYEKLKEVAHTYFKLLGNPRVQLLLARPDILRHFPIFDKVYQDMLRVAGAFFGFFEERIREAGQQMEREEEGLIAESEAPIFVYNFLREKRRRDETGEPHFYTMVQLKNMCFDLWLDGQLTTGSTMAWGVAFLITKPEAQRKLHAELDLVIGCDRLITFADRPNLPYTNAVVNETLRTANVVPENALRRVTKDVVVDGYLIKEGTCIIPQISAVLYNPEIYEDPTNFNPDRFLDENGKLKKCDELIPFSIGRRKCLGQPLAQMEIFLFLANIFNRYKITAGKEPPSLNRATGGIIVECPPFECNIEKRH
ncbi:cytochrome p450 domain-containing protein [Ditylenchus destructor]|uniref:Cytochrome p450 domain-containing protein n=1 Tax=Ditylenchus destructor TaxID=166010 RepID=A0AAD4ND96_9BILA|nr:cytochrome p450 domain-containing protein [Ditylenchus destructor]